MTEHPRDAADGHASLPLPERQTSGPQAPGSRAPDLEASESQARGARPYGWIGLPLSLAGILVLGIALAAVVAGVAFGIGAVALGWHEAVKRASGLVQAMRGDPQASELVALCLSVLLYAAVAVVVFAFARLRGGRQWRDLIGWHPWNASRRRWSFWLIAAVTLAYSLAANEALAYFYPASKDWVTMPQGIASVVVFFVVATLAAPLTEELVFRGWLFTALRARLSLWPSLLLSSALFALAHWESTHLYALVVFPVGIALGLIRERAASLKASIGFHAFYNGFAFLMITLGK